MAVIEALISALDLTTGLIALLALFAVLFWIQTPPNLPPGPNGWPFLGCFPNLAWIKFRTGLEIHEVFKQFGDGYGDVCSLYLGRRLVVLLNSNRAIKEAFQNPGLQDRPQSAVLDDVVIARGVAQASGDSWKQQRRFTQNTFRSFGVGKSSFEDQILTESEALLDQITTNNGEAFDVRHDLGNASANVICSTVFGKRYNYKDTKFRKF
ncbi:cytochrome P450 2J4-like [Amphiura filiformis]|uniref:cytochrome P450 2J4-like n=1 Tax=Amphiura filiformis TaxID=82378 RepID=UPI003B2104D6